MLRILLAGLFVFGAILGVVVLLGTFQSSGDLPPWAAAAAIVVMIAALLAALQFFNAKGRRLSDTLKSAGELVAGLDAAGLVSREKFSARRCFSVTETGDEGPHYYLELDDGRVLFLSGQYLHDYAEIVDDPELNRPASFPCERFEILRHKTEGHVLSIACEGRLLVPELEAPPFSRRDFRRVPADGAIIADKTFDQLKQERASSEPPRHA